MKTIVRWAVNNPPTMNSLLIAILAIGLAAAYQLKRETFPEFTLDMVVVTVAYPGASPAEVERGICQKIEESIRSIQGIKTVLSVSSEGVGVVSATLETYVTDTQKVVNDIRSAVDRIPSFPELSEEPEIRTVILRHPAIQVAVMGADSSDAASEWRLRELAEGIREEILALPTVSQASIMGTRPYQIDVEISETTLRKYGVTLDDVATSIRHENVEVPAGNIKTDTAEFLLRGTNRQRIGSEIAKLPAITSPGGVVLSVGDLGKVVDGFADEGMYSYVNGRPALSVQIDKMPDEDLLAITAEVRDYVEQKQMPADSELMVWFDMSNEVRGRLNLLTRGGLFGLVLVFMCLSLFLNIRLAFWVALGIPVSFLGTCAVMFNQGETLNMLSMFSFVMALGIVVDDAIVIGENIFSHRQKGKSRIEAAIDGTVEVAPAVIASVMTTVITFLPLFFVTGIMGKFIAVMPLAMIAMLLISLFESILILPCHLAHTNVKRTKGWYHRLRANVDRAIFWVIDDLYAPALRWLLNHTGIAFSGSATALMLTLGLIMGGFTPFVLMPQVDGDVLICNLDFPSGTPVTTTEEATRKIERALLEMAEEYKAAGKPFLRLVYRAVGTGFTGDPSRRGDSGANHGFLFADLIPAADRPYITSQQVTKEWRSRVSQIPGAERIQFEGAQMGPGGRAIEFKLVGSNIDELEAAVEKTKDHLKAYTGIYDVADGNEAGKWEIQLKTKRKAEALGITLDQIASTVRASYYGSEVMRLQRGRHEVKLMVRYPAAERRSLAQFEEIRVRTPDGEIPLSELADRKTQRAYSQIVRIDQQRAITVSANIDETVGNSQRVTDDLKQNFLPGLFEEFPGLSVHWEGQREMTTESMKSLFSGFIVAVFGIFLLLTMQFRSYTQPLIIMAVIPFGMIGAVLGHFVQGMPLTFFTMMGVVALSGVVVNDSIVLVDFINRRIAEGVDLDDALIQAGRQRFRPVLLTTITTIAGLLPILVERSMQAQLLIPMATSLSCGLAVATVWILMLVPIMYRVHATWRPKPRVIDDSVDAMPALAMDQIG